MLKIKVNVTQDCIDAGEPCEDQSCPIALAIMAAMPGVWRIKVQALSVQLWNPAIEEYMTGSLPREAQYFIEDFDNNEPVKPFSFDLELLTYEEIRHA